MEILASRMLLRPADYPATLAFYRDRIGLAIAREYPGGTVFFAGQSLIELAGHGRPDDAAGVFGGALWLQVRDVYAVQDQLRERGVEIAREAARLRPDAFILYIGNNEIVGPYGPGTVFGPFTGSALVTRARVLATRTGMGSFPEGWAPGEHYPEKWSRRFAIDFVGGDLKAAAPKGIEPVITLSSGEAKQVEILYVEPFDGYRILFDWYPTSDSTDPVDMRLFLRCQGDAISETWLYQYFPPAPDKRQYVDDRIMK